MSNHIPELSPLEIPKVPVPHSPPMSAGEDASPLADRDLQQRATARCGVGAESRELRVAALTRPEKSETFSVFRDF